MDKVRIGKKALLPHASFRSLNSLEEKAFREWARQHTSLSHLKKSGLYHPCIRDEYMNMGLLEVIDDE